jgi:ATP-binding cassette, subfamily F, member 3
VTTRIVSVRDGKVEVYPGGFSDFAAPSASPHAQPPTPATKKPKPSEAPPPPDDQAKKRHHEAQKQVSRDRVKKERRFKELEDLIAAGDKQLGEMRERLREEPAGAGGWAKIATMATEEQALAKRVEALMSEWTRLGEELG